MSDSEPTLNVGALDSYEISQATKEKLRMRGVEELYPVQYKSYESILSGKNAVVQARTGTGKTFAFTIPLVEKLQKSKKSLKAKQGRKPKVLLLAPTRELAQQISDDFQSIISSKLEVQAVYGGVDFQKHCNAINNGVDVIVGTPGRVKDLLENEKLSFSHVKYVILDEVDRMLDMGFRDDVDSILNPLYETDSEDKSSHPQTLLFSATMPKWVVEFANKYLGDDALHLNLVSDDVNRTAITVEHMALQCPWQERPKIIADVIKCYSCGPESRCIVFCERKKNADELAADSAMSSDCHVLHGDIPQDKRELVLKKFRSGKYKVLVTTNVAARGLDIPNIDLVVQCQPPKDVEDYIHRSGRTGRAGQSGQSICFYTMKEKEELQAVERQAGIKFKRISAPSTSDLVITAHDGNLEILKGIPEATWREYEKSADTVISELGDVRAVACCLAKMSGHTNAITVRSILTCREGFTTYELKVESEEEIYSKSYCFKALKRLIPEDIVETISHLMFVKGRKGFVFDLPVEHEGVVESHWSDGKFDSLSKVVDLPEVEEMERFGGGGYRNGSTNGYENGGGRGRGGDFRGRGRGDGFRGRGRGDGFRGRGRGDGFRGRGRGDNFRGRGGGDSFRGRGGGDNFRGRGGGRGFKRSFDDVDGGSSANRNDSKRVVYNDSD